MRAIAGLLFTLCLIFFTNVARADEVTPNDNVATGVVIRAAPSTSSRRLGILRPGETLVVTGDVPNWHEVRLADGRTGFVSKRWTDLIDTPEEPSEPEAGAAEMFAHFVFVGQGAGAILEFPCGVAVIDTGGQFAGPTDGEVLFNQYLDGFFAAALSATTPSMCSSLRTHTPIT